MDSFESALTVLECDIASAKSEGLLFATVKIYDLQTVLDALTTLQAREATLIRERDAERSFVWKWIERALFDKQLGMENCLSTLAHYPGAPWNEGRWNVDHKPYAEQFYKNFPKAVEALATSDLAEG